MVPTTRDTRLLPGNTNISHAHLEHKHYGTFTPYLNLASARSMCSPVPCRAHTFQSGNSATETVWKREGQLVEYFKLIGGRARLALASTRVSTGAAIFVFLRWAVDTVVTTELTRHDADKRLARSDMGWRSDGFDWRRYKMYSPKFGKLQISPEYILKSKVNRTFYHRQKCSQTHWFEARRL